ncbi:MAG: hypothetical protein ABI994_00635, partial [Gemmatimonadales bacterium]
STGRQALRNRQIQADQKASVAFSVTEALCIRCQDYPRHAAKTNFACVRSSLRRNACPPTARILTNGN